MVVLRETIVNVIQMSRLYFKGLVRLESNQFLIFIGCIAREESKGTWLKLMQAQILAGNLEESHVLVWPCWVHAKIDQFKSL